VIYYDFQRISQNKHKSKKEKPSRETVMEVKWLVLRDREGLFLVLELRGEN